MNITDGGTTPVAPPAPPTNSGTTAVQNPAAGGSPYSTPIPNPTSYLQASLLAKTAYQNALARISNQRNTLLRNSGYTGQFDNSGNLSNLQVDQTNLYGQYQQMNRGNAIEDQGAQNSALDRGLYGSGLANRNLSRLRYTHGANASQFGSNLIGSLSDLATSQGDAFNQYNSALWQAQLLAAQQAISDQNFNPALDPSAGGYTPLMNPNGTSSAINWAQRQNYFTGGVATPSGAAKTTAPSRYYTYKTMVPLGPGQTVHYTPGRGYYAA